MTDENGQILIPRGSPAHLIVDEVGDGDLALDLRSVRVNGRRYIPNAENILDRQEREGIGANKRTGEFLGGGTLLGTIIAAVAGGGKGAAVGALAGGAAGAGVQVLTRGPELHIHSEPSFGSGSNGRCTCISSSKRLFEELRGTNMVRLQ